jgi:transposase-like protein
VSTVPILYNAPFPFNSHDLKEIEAWCRNHVLDTQTQERLIIDLIGKANSPHEIEDHVWNVFRIERKYHAIRKVVLKTAKKAQRINHFFDLLACQTLLLVEIDETFKGRHISLLVVVDALTGYIFMIMWLPQRSKEEIIKAMAPLKDLFENVQLVLTDGAPYFPDVIKEICPNAQHQRCLIHILRNLYPFIIPQRQAFIGAMKKVSKAKAIYQAHKENHAIRLRELDALKHQERYWEKKRTNIQTALGIKRYQKNIYQQYPQLKKLYNRINGIQAIIRPMSETAKHDRERLSLLKGDIDQAIVLKNIAWNLYMKSLHVLYEFYNLFRRSPAKFDAAREHYLTKLVNRPTTDLSKAIIRVLTESKDLSTIYTKNCPLKLNRNFINTNIIESVNSRLRPVLDKLKKIQNTPYLSAILELIRLRLNASRPYSKLHSESSPIERCGYKLRSRTWIDLIFNGLPPGPQSQKTLGNLNLEESYPGRFHHEKENRSVKVGLNA